MPKERKARKGAARRAPGPVKSEALALAMVMAKKDVVLPSHQRGKAKRPKATADDLIAEKLETKYQLTEEQMTQVKRVLEHNDSCDSHNKKVRIEKMWKLLHDHYGFKAGVKTLIKLVCESLGRTSWGNP